MQAPSLGQVVAVVCECSFNVYLTLCPLLHAPHWLTQILRWQHKRPHEQIVGVSTRSRMAASSSSGAQQA
jgi:hypothetical protein